MTDHVTAVTVRYWAGAQTAAGLEQELLTGGTVGEVLEQATAAHPALGPVLEVASVLVDGRVSDRGRPLAAGDVLEVLPPFAGG